MPHITNLIWSRNRPVSIALRRQRLDLVLMLLGPVRPLTFGIQRQQNQGVLIPGPIFMLAGSTPARL